MDGIKQWGLMVSRKHNNFPVLMLILINLMLAPFIISHYGESWDENHQYEHYAVHALNSYGTWFQTGQSEGLDETTGVVKDLHGPAYVMTVELITQFLLKLGIQALPTEIRHFLHFLTFQLGLFSLYSICRQWLSAWPALGATLLFMTQPVLWGHGIINPKDMPFAVLFLLSIALGLRMFDYLLSGTWDQVSSSWSILDTRTKRTIGLIVSIWLLSIFGLFAEVKFISDYSVNIINFAYNNPNSTLTVLISHVAKNFGVVPAEIYSHKLFMTFLRVRGIYTILSAIFVYRIIFKRFQPGLLLLGKPVTMAAIALGFATSMRIAGPLAGILVVLYCLGRAGRKAILPLAIYGIVAIASMYMTWPYLWNDPVGRLLESVRVMSAFPWQQTVLFNGVYYRADALPVTYLPVLLALQLTEPVWLLFFIGVIVATVGFIKEHQYGGMLFLLIGWFILPVVVFSLGGVSFYDNFRQVLFILPPIFLMAGVAFSKIKQPVWQIVWIVIVILPGIVDGIRLHPYEYIYYNRFIGGVNGAQRRFELDYWGTSYREAAEHLNGIASPNSHVWVEGPAHVFEPFARNDLKVLDAFNPTLTGKEYYVVALSRFDYDRIIAPSAKVIYTVTRDGAPLAVIKKP